MGDFLCVRKWRHMCGAAGLNITAAAAVVDGLNACMYARRAQIRNPICRSRLMKMDGRTREGTKVSF